MRYEDYIANLARLAVEVVNAGSTRDVEQEMFTDHDVIPPSDLAELLPLLKDAVQAVATGGDLEAVNTLLTAYPPDLHISTHDGLGDAHLHHARNGENGLTWLGRGCAAGLAHVATGVPDVVVGQCQAVGCGRFYVDQSRNHSRKFCSNACASRTTVAAYRARLAGA